MVARPPHGRRLNAAILGAVAAVSLGAPALAQSMSANSASFNAGYGRSPDQENRAVDPDTRDANGNRLIIDGVIVGGSSSSSAFAGGAASAFAGAGAGAGSATAIGNNLTVITEGNNNTVIVDSRQTNTGTVIATQSQTVTGNGN
jgi:holdfast attachment protein HfaA